MKITIDLSDFYLDEEQEFEPALKAYVIREAIHHLTKQVSDETKLEMEKQIKQAVTDSFQEVIDAKIQEVIITETLPSRHNSKTMLPLTEYIKEYFTYSGGWNSFPEHIKNESKKIADELKKRYDLLFATQIVTKISENGLLREDVANLLLDKKPA